MRAPSQALLRYMRPLTRRPLHIAPTSTSSILAHHRPGPVPNHTERPCKHMHTSAPLADKRDRSDLLPTTADRGPVSKEDTQTDFDAMNVLGSTPPPSTSIDACLSDGFHLDNGVKISGGAGLLLVAGEAFEWRPWVGGKLGMVNAKGQWEVSKEAWGVLEVVWPKPELLILGLGPTVRPLAPETRKAIQDLGIRVDVLDTRNAAAQFNLLATERGVGGVAAGLIPIGRKE